MCSAGPLWGWSDVFPAKMAPCIFSIAQGRGLFTPSTEAGALGSMDLGQEMKEVSINQPH